MPTFFRPLGKQQLDWQHEHASLSVVFLWRSWSLKVFVPQQMEKYCHVFDHYPWYLFKQVRVTPLKHLRVNPSFMPLHPIMALLHLCIPRLLLPLLLCYRQLALSMNNPAIKVTGWVLCLRVYISVLSSLKKFSSPPTIKFKCVSQPLRHS